MPILVKRLQPGQDLYLELKKLVTDCKINAGVILCLVGSLKTANLRLANQSKPTSIDGPLEIVSGTGTLSTEGLHVHASVSDSTGKTTGGHLVEGCKVYTTCEIVVHDFSNEWKFERVLDVSTGYPELKGIQLHLK